MTELCRVYGKSVMANCHTSSSSLSCFSFILFLTLFISSVHSESNFFFSLKSYPHWVSITICRFVIVDCVTYPHAVFSHQCQVFPYNLATPTLTTPLSSAVVLYQIAQTQVSGGRREVGEGVSGGGGRWERAVSGGEKGGGRGG